ncbi:uncharacterized protein LOC101238239 [Hydra vulgaris]|uniref:Uncharacterized protein LOC101238239 n=1 Tax=Hydra vulgaris TaxID=6087 RepID=A0ABM4CGU2_HYDVU
MTVKSDNKNGCCSLNPKWFCTFEGLFKLLEFFAVLLSWVICRSISNEVKDLHVTSRFVYFLLVGIICWIFIGVIIILYFSGCFEYHVNKKIERLYGWYIFLLASSLTWFFFWLFTSVLLVFYRRYWVGLLGAAVFGFISTILFLIDSITYYRLCRKYRVVIRKEHRSILENQAI